MRLSLWAKDDWPIDPRFDQFQDAVWELSVDGEVKGHLLSMVARMASFRWIDSRDEWLWYAIVWADGTVDRPNEDYGPGWYVVSELEQGYFEDGLVYAARRIEGRERDAIWAQHSHHM